MKRLRWTVVLVAAAVLLGGCGEVTNQLTPRPGTANTITLALDAAPNFSEVGIADADALGYFTQTDERVRFLITPHPIDALTDGRAQIALSSEPQIIITRNGHTALASVAAVLQGPAQIVVACATPGQHTAGKPGSATSTSTTAATPTTTSTPRAHPPLHAQTCATTVRDHPVAAYADAPTYNALDLVVTEAEIVDDAPVIRRFVQAVGRGYAAARSDPAGATANLVKLSPGLDDTEQLAGVRASLTDFFPAGPAANRPWGWQVVSDWNAFGSWLLDHHIISDINATPDADTNELLAGQGV